MSKKVNKTSRIIVIIVLLSCLLLSVILNIYILIQPPLLIGIVDHKSIGEGTDDSGQPIIWYTVSLWLVTEDPVNGHSVSEIFAYVVEKEDFDNIADGDIVKGIPLRDVRFEIKEILHKMEPTISIVSSDGRCGDLEEPFLTLDKDADGYVLLQYLESANVPCYRHVILEKVILERWPTIIKITLEFESTSEVCVECVGTIDTTLRVGPISEGTEIIVNDLRVVV